MIFVVLVACQEPFGADRHDLVGFRIAAMSAPAAIAGDEIAPRVAMIVDDRPWATRPADLAWFWVAEDDDLVALDPLSVADGVGPTPLLTVPDDRRRLAVVARHDGDEARAFLDLPLPPSPLPGFPGLSLGSLPLDMATVAGPDLLLDARSTLPETPATEVTSGGLARITAILDGEAPGSVIRWMATAGTFFELDAFTTDWAPGELPLDEDTIDGTVEPLPDGPVTFVALLVGPDRHVAWTTTEIHVGPPEPGIWVEGRWIPTDEIVSFAEGDAIRGTLVSDDASPVGLRLTQTQLEPAAEVIDWGTTALGCLVAQDGPFDPGWMIAQICGRDAAAGTTVALVAEVRP